MPGNLENVAGLKAFLKANYVETLALVPALTLLTLLAFIVHIDRYIRADLKRTMRFIILALFSLVAQNFLEYRLSEGENQWLARTLVAIYGYAIRPVILILFLRVVAPEKRFGWAWALAGINAAVNATALFSHVCFLDQRRQPLSWRPALLYVSVRQRDPAGLLVRADDPGVFAAQAEGNMGTHSGAGADRGRAGAG